MLTPKEARRLKHFTLRADPKKPATLTWTERQELRRIERLARTLQADQWRVETFVDELRSCAVDGRVDFVVSKWIEEPVTGQTQSGGQDDPVNVSGEWRPTSGFSLTFDLPQQLTTPPITKHVQRGSPAGTAALSLQTTGTGVERQTPPACPVRYSINVDLDATGVGSTRFRNPRWPPYLGPNDDIQQAERIRLHTADQRSRPRQPIQPPGQIDTVTELHFQQCADLVFSNRLVDRRFVVTFTGIKPAMRWPLMEVPGISTRCEGDSCSASLVVGPGVAGTGVRLLALRRTYIDAQPPQREPITFTVGFFEDDREPAYARGYFSLVQLHQMSERKSGLQWSAAASADVASIPDLIELDPKVQPSLTAPPSVRANDSRAQGAVRLSLRQNVGARASGEFELRLKTGEFGGSEPSVAATKYRVDVNLLNGLTLTGGRFVVAAPGETVALSEAGDNIGFRAGPLAANYILRKQVRNALPDILNRDATETDRDHTTAVVQLNGIPLWDFRAISFDFFGVRGERSFSRSILETLSLPAARVDRTYWTLGGEANWLLSRAWRWSTSLYRSEVSSEFGKDSRELANDQGQGWTLFQTLSFTAFDDDPADLRQGVDWTIQGRVGLGSEDDPETPLNRESYGGETNPFAPDVLFLNAIVPALEANGLLSKGLSNKAYLGLSITRPIRGLAELLQLPKGEIGTVSASLRIHRYWNRGKIDDDHSLATEYNASISAEIPRGVKTLITVAHLRPGEALSNISVAHATGALPVLTKPVWSVIGQMSLTLQ